MTKLRVRGIQVNVKVWNEFAEQTLVLLHGFTGSISTWEQIASLLPNTIRVIAIDLIGHGKTDAPGESSRYTMMEQVADLEEIFVQLQLRTFTLLGYSLGGRVALSYACAFPQRIKQLILESSSPGLKTEEEQQARILSDEQLANKIEQNGVEAFVRSWENIPLFATQKKLPIHVQQAIRTERLSQTAIGLANSLRGMGTGAQKSIWPDLKKIYFPVYLLTGESDQKFCKIAEEMKKLIPNVEHIVVSNVGHAIHVENSTIFATIVEKVLTQ